MSIYTHSLQKLFVSFFNRPADTNGLQFWESVIERNNGNLALIAAEFAKSSEYLGLIANRSSSQLIEQIYLNLFGRSAEPAGLAFWSNLLNHGTLSIAEIALRISENAQGSDAQAFAAKVNAASSFTDNLDTPEKIAAYNGDAAIKVAKNFLASVKDAATLDLALEPANLNTVVKSVIATHVTPTPTPTPTVTILNITAGGIAALDASDQPDLIRINVTAVGGDEITATNKADLSITDRLGSGNSEINGGHRVTLNALEASSGLIQIGNKLAPSDAVNVIRHNIGPGMAGATNIQGGTSISLIQTHLNPDSTSTNGSVVIGGTAATTSVRVWNAENVKANTVVINDWNTQKNALGSIDTVSLNHYSSVSIVDNALSKLKLANSQGSVTIDNSATVSDQAMALYLELDSIKGGALTDSGIYTTFDIKLSGADSSLGKLDTKGVSSLTLRGDQHLTLSDISGLTKLQTVVVSEAAGLSMTLDNKSVSLVDASGSSGDLIVDASKHKTSLTLKGGQGDDHLIVNGDSPHQISVGSGADTVSILSINPSVNTYQTIMDAHLGMVINLGSKHGTSKFDSQAITLNSNYVFQDYVNTVISKGGDASVNGALGWFQYDGNTFLVQSRHNSQTMPVFSNGTDFILRFNGLIDLSKTTLLTNEQSTSLKLGNPLAMTLGDDQISPSEQDPLDGSNIITAVSMSDQQTLNGQDIVDAGDGHDTLRILSSTKQLLSIPHSVKVSNIEDVDLQHNGRVVLDTSTWHGLQKIDISASGGNHITAHSSTNISLNEIGLSELNTTIDGGANVTLQASQGGAGSIAIGKDQEASGDILLIRQAYSSTANAVIETYGGKNINITQKLYAPNNSQTSNAQVIVHGGQQTKDVTIVNAAKQSKENTAFDAFTNSVQIWDSHANSATPGTIEQVTVSHFDDLMIADNALTSLNLTGGQGKITIANGGMAKANTTLNLSLNNVHSSGLSDANVYSTLNVTTSGQASSLSEIISTSLTDLNLTLNDKLSLGAKSAVNLENVTINGKGNLSADFSSSVKSIDASQATGGHSITLNSAQTVFKGGSGSDRVIINTTPTVLVDGGNGSDSIEVNNELLQDLISNKNIVNFENLYINTPGNRSYDFSTLTSLFAYINVRTENASNLTLHNMPIVGGIEITGSGENFLISSGNLSQSQDDHLNLTLRHKGSNPLVLNNVVINDFENLSISSADYNSPSDFPSSTLELDGNSLQNVYAWVENDFSLNFLGTQLPNLTATGNQDHSFELNAQQLTGDTNIYGYQSLNRINLGKASANLIYSSGEALDIITAGGGKHVITLEGQDDDRLTLTAASKDIVSAPTVVGAHGGLGITLGNVSAGFNPNAVTLGKDASLRDYADAVVNSGKLGWFQFQGDTWLVNGEQNMAQGFIDGQDFILKLVGNLDLTKARLDDQLLILPTVITFDGVDPVVEPSKEQQLAGNDSFYANMDASLTEINIHDYLDAGKGDDTLHINVSGGPAYITSTLYNVETINIISDDQVGVASHNWHDVKTLNINNKNGGTVQIPNETMLSINNVLSGNDLTIMGGKNLHINIEENDGGYLYAVPAENQQSKVLVNNKLAGEGSYLFVAGGQHIEINQLSANAINTTAKNSSAIVYADQETQAIVINNAPAATASNSTAGMQLSAVSVHGSAVNSKLESVSIKHFDSADFFHESITNLKLAHGIGAVNFHYSSADVRVPAMDLHLDDVHITDLYAGQVEKLMLHTNGGASSIDTMNFYQPILSEITLDGNASLTINSEIEMWNLKQVKLADEASLTANFTNTSIELIDASQSSGAHQLTLNAGIQSFVGGKGDEQITLVDSVFDSKLSGGAGNDKLILKLYDSLVAEKTWDGFENLDLFIGGDKSLNLSLQGDFQTIRMMEAGTANLVFNSPSLTLLDASPLDLLDFTAGAVASALTVKGSAHGSNLANLAAAQAPVTYIGSSGMDLLTVKNGNNLLTTGGGPDTITILGRNANVNTMSSITDAAAGLTIDLIAQGSLQFSTTPIQLANTAVLQDYVNAVIMEHQDKSNDSGLGWFHYMGDTYLVQSLHDGASTPSFVDGVDVMVKLVGLVDLSTAQVTGNGLSLVG